jgi:hypothetical protein
MPWQFCMRAAAVSRELALLLKRQGPVPPLRRLVADRGWL